MKITVSAAAEVVHFMRSVIEKNISDAFKFLLENKHLYQNHEVPVRKFGDLLMPAKLVPEARGFEDRYKILLKSRWDDIKNTEGQPLTDDVIKYTLPTVKMYCAKSTCKRIEPFNPMSSFDILNSPPHAVFDKFNEQLFVVVYHCQSCKGLPEVFLIKRNGWKINIAGRSPIETVTTKPYLPKDYSKYISQAMLAFNSGQILAGLFLMRVFIEQYSKKIAGDGMADEVIQRYSETLPTDFKGRFPSLSKVYSNLSEAIHKASPDEQIFTKSLSEINEHFDGKRLFKLKDPDS